MWIRVSQDCPKSSWITDFVFSKKFYTDRKGQQEQMLELVVCLYLLLSLSVFTRSCIIMVRTMAGVALTIACREFVSLWGIFFWSVGAAHEKCKLETEAKLKCFLANFSVWNLSVKLFLVGFSSSCVSSSLLFTSCGAVCLIGQVKMGTTCSLDHLSNW